MKKNILFSLALGLIIPISAGANQKNCMYHPLQNIIRSARTTQDVETLITDQINFNIDFQCGGSVQQLAILRGNPKILQVLIEKGGLNPNEQVDNSIYPIKGAPKVLPIAFFAAYYAPSSEILSLLISNGASIYKKDANGQNILWYIEQNPVLRNTDLSDQIIKNLLISDTNEQNKKEDLAKMRQQELEKKQANAKTKPQTKKEAKPLKEITTNKKTEKSETKEEVNLKETTPQQTETSTEEKPAPTLIQEEPEQAFQPPQEDANAVDLQASDF